MQNQFDILSESSDFEDSDYTDVISMRSSEMDSVKPKKDKSSSTEKPSPIIITDTKLSTGSIISLCNTVNVTNFSVKKISIGLKIFVSNSIDFNKLVEALKQMKTEFYTHRSKTDKVFKVVLSGLD